MREQQQSPDDGMCPNCVTPWKCNGPHLPTGMEDVTLTEFLLARIAEDEEFARGHLTIDLDFWPHRMLAECAAKRRIVEACSALEDKVLDNNLWFIDQHDAILCALAAVYADHPDYDPTWALDGAA